MLLLRPAPAATITAGASGSNVGYGDGAVVFGSPGAAFGAINFTPSFFSDQSVVIHYANTDTTYFNIFTDGALAGIAGLSVVIGAETYPFSAATSSSLSGGKVRYRWTKTATLVNGTSYSFKVV